jgi:sugar/nucleoside kinase (ribokinase family)
MKREEILCIGVALLDLPLGPIDENVFRQETTMLPKIPLTTGGDALNQATILRRLGEKVALIGHIGDDRLGRQLLYHCWQEGIDADSMVVEKGAETRINVVLVTPDGQRNFLKNDTAVSRPFHSGDIDLERVKRAKAVSLASLFASKLRDPAFITQVLTTAKAAGATTFADTVPPTSPDVFASMLPYLPYIDFLTPNEEEASLLTGEADPETAAARFLEAGVGTVVIKLGADGCLIATRTQSIHVEGYLAKTIDTTGAGDTFAAAFLSAILGGKSHEEAGRLANRLAARSTEYLGATPKEIW